MKKQLTNETIVNSINILGELNNAKLPIKVAYAITKNVNKINSEIKPYNIEKLKLLDKYAEKNEKGEIIIENGHFKIKEECVENWNKEIKELLEIENEIDIHMIKLDDLLNSNYNISPAELSAIAFMIEE